jgi:hypothetical protein
MLKRKTVITFVLTVGLGFAGAFSFGIFNQPEEAKADKETKIDNPAAIKSEEEVEKETLNGAVVPEKQTLETWEKALALTDEQKVENADLKKWILRTIVEQKITGEFTNIGEAVKKAKERYEFEKDWLELATDHYKITYTEQEVDEWIAKGPDKHPVDVMRAKAEALGISLEEMNHEHDRDLYVKWVVWAKLVPVLAEKYNVDLKGVDIGKNEPTPNTVLVRHYEKEVKDYLKQ